MAPKTDLRITQTFVALSVLIFMFLMPFQTVASNTIALKGCQDSCGGIPVPYPFGISPNCSLDGFELGCNTTSSGSQILFPTDLFGNNLTVLNISLSLGQVRVNQKVSFFCYNPKTHKKDYNYNEPFSSYGTPYLLNNEKNKFTAIGCISLAIIQYNSLMTGSRSRVTMHQGGCIISDCYKPGGRLFMDNPCSGRGCCQTSIPTGIDSYIVGIDREYFNRTVTYWDTYTPNFSWCSYAMVTVDDGLSGLNTNYYTDNYTLFEQEMPLLLDWAIRFDGHCEIARTNQSSFACRSSQSVCVNSTNGPGYICQCSNGYEGNPYLEDFQGGCQDIDECAKEINPCNKKKCHNLPGSYRCSCSLLMRRLPGTTSKDCQLYMPYLIGAIIILGFGIGITILLSYFAIAKHIKLFEKRRREKEKQKYFIQNHGLLLQQLIDSHDDTTQKMRIFGLDELEKATNRFDDALVLGRGGHGEVYKGILSDQRVAAIKRSKTINKEETGQFINEMVILSNVNHRNVVKLFGCCLETEVPLLVYEFVSNGTLSDHLHAKEHCSLTWRHRLRIALEAAGAISYLHSSASRPVLHRDIKSSNILVDDYFTAKVSDFGISRSVQLDQTGIDTIVQGTFGYIDPEYFQTGRLTHKSDVFSFGVILVELLTREKPTASSRMFEEGTTMVDFDFAMRENHLFEIIDPEVVYEENRTELKAVAELAEMCLRRTGEERPTMKEVEQKLDSLWRSNTQHSRPEMSQVLELMSLEEGQPIPAESDTTQYFTL